MNNFLAITYAFMLGFCPYDEVGTNGNIERFDNATHVQFELGIDILDCVKLYAGEETLQIMADSLFNWIPYTQNYFVGAEFHKDFSEKLNLRAGIRHSCQHPCESWGKQKSTFNCARTEIYIGVSGKVNIF